MLEHSETKLSIKSIYFGNKQHISDQISYKEHTL